MVSLPFPTYLNYTRIKVVPPAYIKWHIVFFKFLAKHIGHYMFKKMIKTSHPIPENNGCIYKEAVSIPAYEVAK